MTERMARLPVSSEGLRAVWFLVAVSFKTCPPTAVMGSAGTHISLEGGSGATNPPKEV